MNKSIAIAYSWCQEHQHQLQDISVFILTIFFGAVLEMNKEPDSPKKWQFRRFVVQLGFSFLIAVTFYQINEMWLHFPYLFSMTLCVWLGSSSNTIILKFDELVASTFDSLKTFFANKLQIIVVLFSVGIMTVGCKARAIETTDIKEVKTTTEIAKDKEVVKNLAIIDSLKMLIAKVKTSRPECDSITNAKIDELLSQINSQKTSGNNAFGVYYDKLKRELIAYAKIGETASDKTNIIYNKDKVFTQTVTKNIPTKYIPKWVQYLAYLGAFLLVCLVVWGILKIKKVIPV